MVHMCTIVPAG